MVSEKSTKYRLRKMITTTRVLADILDPITTENSTANETQQTKESSEDEELARLLNLIIRPFLIVFGTIGNGLSFYIMRQGSLKKMSTCFYLSILALADTSRCFVI